MELASESGNYPVLLVRRKKQSLAISPELDASWFGSSRSKALESSRNDRTDSAEHGSFQLVSRRRLRWAHALFLLLFGAVLALLVWEVHTHFGGVHSGSRGQVLYQSTKPQDPRERHDSLPSRTAVYSGGDVRRPRRLFGPG